MLANVCLCLLKIIQEFWWWSNCALLYKFYNMCSSKAAVL